MKKVYPIFIIGLITLILGITGCAPGNAGANTMSANADNFNFIFKYGFSGRNTLDAFKGIYTKDMGLEAPITIELKLTPEEMNSIYQKMVETDFFNYPDKFSVILPSGEMENRVMLYFTYFFKVTYHGQTKELLWHEKVTNSEVKADKLRELIKLIRDIIESREEYKKLPEPKAGYL
jgi:hypothetical protein